MGHSMYQLKARFPLCKTHATSRYVIDVREA